MFSASDVAKEIKNVGELLEKRGQSAGASALATGMIQNMRTKLSKLSAANATFEEANSLYDSIKASVLPDEHKQTLIAKVDGLMSTPLDAEHATAPAAVKPQLCTSIGQYLTQDEWDQINNPNLSWVAKTNILIGRLKKLGFRSLHEQTSKWRLAIWRKSLTSQPEADLAWDMLNDFKDAFAKADMRAAAPYIQKYPSKPHDLPDNIFAAAYPDSEPVDGPQDQIKWIAGKVLFCRSTSKKLQNALKKTGSNPSISSNAAASSSARKGAEPKEDQMAEFMKNMQSFNPTQMMFAGMMAQMQQSNCQFPGMTSKPGSPEKRKAKALEDKHPSPSKQLALPAPSSFELKKRKARAPEEEPILPGASLPQQNALQDPAMNGNQYEQELFQSLLERNDEAKAKARAKAKANAGPQGKAKAFPKAKAEPKAKSQPRAKAQPKAKSQPKAKAAVMRKPSASLHAAANADEFIAEKPSQDDLQLEANIYHSRISHKARTYALKVLCMDEEKAKSLWQGQESYCT